MQFKDDPEYNRTLKFLMLDLIVAAFDISPGSDHPLRECWEQDDVFSYILVDMYNDIDVFKTATIDPRFRDDHKSLGMPFRLNF